MKKQIYFLIASALLMCSCDDIFENEIQGTVEPILPKEGQVFQTLNVDFWWENLPGAQSYRIQLVKPNFTVPVSVVFDQVLDTNYFSYSLSPGNYQYRIKGKNSAYESEWNTVSFVVDTNSTLIGEAPILTFPKVSDTLNSNLIRFEWLPLFNADNYLLEVYQPDFSGTLDRTIQTSSNTTLLSLSSNGPFAWRVRAENSNSYSNFSNAFSYWDTIAPSAPVLFSPAAGSQITNPILLNWQRISDNGASLKDSILISSDPNFGTFSVSSSIQGTSFSDSLNVGEYFWKVFTVDGAGNISQSSEIRSFQVF
ncbi:MAG: hypothetical protein HWD92_03125 [Flavobacteriia bacterium]|nr:hypothetical protein [Flavobacteriia bacterium]